VKHGNRHLLERFLNRPAPERLSQAALEVLSIVAYKQPITRAEISHIRGTDSSRTTAAAANVLTDSLVRFVDQRDNRSYLVDYAGSVLSSFTSPARNASGITAGATAGAGARCGSAGLAQRVEPIDAETGDVLGALAFPAKRSHGMYWDERDGSLSVAETNGGHIYRFEPRSGELLEEWRIEGPEVHGLARSADGRVWVGDAATNEVLVVER
jgi:streptogramin lyase